MADDLTEADDRLAHLYGIDNHPHGFILLRIFRLVKVIGTRLKALEDRVSRLEGTK